VTHRKGHLSTPKTGRTLNLEAPHWPVRLRGLPQPVLRPELDILAPLRAIVWASSTYFEPDIVCEAEGRAAGR